MTRERFEEIAQQAYDKLPDRFRHRIDNVRIVIEDLPDPETARDQGVGRRSLLGLYQGVPLPHRNSWYGATPTTPDTITLYRKNIESYSGGDEAETERQIVETLLHELGHYFGMNEEEVRRALDELDE
ncbi:MAG: metallopeptidase family protein [Bacteroidota bacterium]